LPIKRVRSSVSASSVGRLGKERTGETVEDKAPPLLMADAGGIGNGRFDVDGLRAGFGGEAELLRRAMRSIDRGTSREIGAGRRISGMWM
jgi:hypothetical protein